MSRMYASLAILSSVLLLSMGALAQPIPGPNVNMVSGTKWPGGDPNLQKQNEPSIAVSTRNPMHLLAGANDYRTVDFAGLPFVLEDEVTPDAWLGVFKSYDGGATWRSTLLPGCPWNTTNPADNPCIGSPVSPLRGKGYTAGADPTVRAGTNGLFYYSGIVFDRNDRKNGATFVATFIDDNNREVGDIRRLKDAGDPIRYVGTSVVDMNAGGQFTDKPWLAVDKPRDSATCRIPGPGGDQIVPASNVYVAYTIFLGNNSENAHTKLYVATSTDCARTWTKTKVSETNAVNQGATLAIDPDTGAVYVAWRRFKKLGGPGQALETDTILVAKSVDFGRKFTKGVEVVPSIVPFDQSTSQSKLAFRTNSYPAMAVATSSPGRVYLAWAERVGPPAITGEPDARIVLYSSSDGITWSYHGPVDTAEASPGNPAGRSHQLMPALSFVGGKLMLVYYDLREDHTYGLFTPLPGNLYSESRTPTGNLPGSPQLVFTPLIADGTAGLTRRHTIDVRVKQILLTTFGPDLSVPAARVSRYMFGQRADSPLDPIRQLQFNPPDLPMFRRGTVPFFGDYIDIGGQAFVTTSPDWIFNTAPSNSTVFHAVWTDNRNVRPGKNSDANRPDKYAPPGSSGGASFFDPTQTKPVCTPGASVPGMMNQDIYTARIDQGLVVGALGNAKPLSPTFQRSFSFFVRNSKPDCRSYQLTIEAPLGVQASFKQAEMLTSLNVTVGPKSSIARNVYVKSSTPQASFKVRVLETSLPACTTPVSSPPLEARIQLNVDPTNPEIENPEIENPDPLNLTPISASEIYNPEIENPEIENPEIENPEIENPEIENPEIENVEIANPEIENPEIENPEIENPEIENPEIENPEIENIPPVVGQITDVEYKVKNKGNTTASYNARLLLNQNVPPGIKLQLLVHRLYRTPVAKGCDLKVQTQNVVLANIPSPVFTSLEDAISPDAQNAATTNGTFTLAPGDTAKLTLRLLDPNNTAGPNLCGPPPLPACAPGDFNPTAAFTPVVASQAANVNPPANTPPPFSAFAPSLTILNSTLPGGAVGTAYSAFLVAAGGVAPRTWSVSSGSLPAGLSLNSFTGQISGTPSGPAGASNFTIQVQDSSPVPQTATRALSITVVASLPAAVNLVFTTHPSNTLAGQVISPAVQVQALSSAAVPVPGLNVTLAIGTNPGGGTLSGTTTVTTGPAGFAVFSNLAISNVGAGYTLVASATGAPSATSNPFTVGIGFGDLIVANGAPFGSDGRILRVAPDGSSAGVIASLAAPACPNGVAVDTSGNVLVADPCVGPRILKVQPNGTVTTLRSGAPFAGPVAVAVDLTGNIIVGDNNTDTIYRMTPDGATVTALASLGGSPAVLQAIRITVDPASGDLIVANENEPAFGQSTIRRISGSGAISIVVSGPSIPRVSGIAVDLAGNYVAASFSNDTIYRVSPAGVVTTIVSSPSLSGNMTGLAVDFTGNFMIAVNGVAGGAPRILKVTPTGAISTILAGGLASYPQDIAIYRAFSAAAFTATGSLSATRASHTATLLPNGKVLVAGGGGSTAELYDPSAGTFSPTGSMSAARAAHTATLLNTGKVLMAGGGVATAELYDPAAGGFSATGSLSTVRSDHTATLLPDGKVLIAGGHDASTATLATTEIYDPGTGLFTAGPSMPAVDSRELHTATRLGDGRVLIADGRSGSFTGGFVFLASAYLYNPVGGTLTPTASLNTARTTHAAALLPNGKVLISGGFNFGDLTSAELYDPGGGTFAATGSMSTARHFHTATLLVNGRVLVTGGLSASTPVASAEIYDPAGGSFSSAGLMTAPRWVHRATPLPSGKVLVTGGSGLASAELYSPAP